MDKHVNASFLLQNVKRGNTLKPEEPSFSNTDGSVSTMLTLLWTALCIKNYLCKATSRWDEAQRFRIEKLLSYEGSLRWKTVNSVESYI